MVRQIATLLVLCGLLFSTVENACAQSFARKYWNSLVNDSSDLSEPQLLVYPTLAYAPETSWEIGLSTLYVFFADKDTTNRLSEINAFTFVTLENQYGLWFDHAIYSDRDKWFFLGRLRFQSFPLFYHGIGIETPEDYVARVEATQVILKERVLRKVKNDIFIGLELDYQRLANVQFEVTDAAAGDFTAPRGNTGSTNIGIGLGVVQDNRHNVLNVRKGLFSELAFLSYDRLWGSSYDFTSIISDTRIYRPVGEWNVLAAQLLGQFNIGDVPFNQLALMGGESMMRGYYLGRYRDKNLLAAQVEYRLLPLPLSFTERIGMSVFAGGGTVFGHVSEVRSRDFVFSGGVGLQFLLFPKKDIWTRLDIAVTQEDVGYYLFIGQAF